jgi:hypothetical protein
MSWLLTLPIIIPFATAVAAYMVKDRPAGAGCRSWARSCRSSPRAR